MSQNNILLADGFDDAIIGIDTSNEVFRIIYDKQKMADILQEKDGMSMEDSWAYLEYSVFGAHVGEGSPIYGYEGGYERVLEIISQL